MDESIIATYGYWGVFLWSALDHTGTPAALIVALSLTVTGVLDLHQVMLFAFFGAFMSDLILYGISYLIGPLFIKYITNIFPRLNLPLTRCEIFLEKYGAQVVVWGRFLAIISRYIPIICGATKMHVIRYIIYSCLGNLLMNFFIGFIIYKFWLELNHYVTNPETVIYISIGIIIGQIIITSIYFKYKKRKTNS